MGEISVDTRMEQDWVVRLIKDNGFMKTCIGEELFIEKPTQEQILGCLLRHKDANFASVVERYSLHRKLPFI